MKKIFSFLNFALILSLMFIAGCQENPTPKSSSSTKSNPTPNLNPKSELIDHLADQMTNCRRDTIYNDTLSSKWKFVFPKENGDILLRHVIDDLHKEKKELEKYYADWVRDGGQKKDNGMDDDIEMAYDVKMYAKGKVISVVVNNYMDCCSLPSPSYSSTTYNYLLFENKVYKITLPADDAELNKKVDVAIKEKFDEDCISDGEVVRDYCLFINKDIWINNPFQSKLCDDDIVVRDGLKYLKFTRVD